MSRISPPSLNGQVVLGRYRILRRLAHGGMGSVFLGRTEGAEGFARPVVIKRVLPGLMDDREVVQMFVREARILSNLQHPNIVPVLDFGQESNGAYLMVLEYVHGYQLAEWQQFVSGTRGHMPVEFALHIISKVLDALHYAHTFRRADGKTMQIIHRDVTPTNVLLTDQGGVKLLDFGIARVSGDENNIVTERARVKGKLPYLPVEAFQGVEPSVASDIYSAGLTLYELLTGTNPFLGRETAHIYMQILQTVPTPVHELRDDVSLEVDAVLQRAMHKDAAQRYTTAAEFAQALRALRKEPEDIVAGRLSSLLNSDFYGAMPEHMSLEPLNSRELAWRAPSTAPGAQSPNLPAHDSAAAAPAENGLAPEHITVRGDVSPSIMAAARSSNAPAPPNAILPAPTAATSARRGLVLAAVAAAGGAVAAIAAWSAMAPQPAVREQLVVIQREPAHAALASTRAAANALVDDTTQTPVAPVPQPSAAEAEPMQPPAVVTAPKPERTAPAPATPDPVALTKIFGRKQARVEACFHQHSSAPASLPALSLHFRVDEAGEVAGATLDPADMAGTPLGVCLLQVARDTHFGALRRAVAFRIPLSIEKIAKP